MCLARLQRMKGDLDRARGSYNTALALELERTAPYSERLKEIRSGLSALQQ